MSETERNNLNSVNERGQTPETDTGTVDEDSEHQGGAVESATGETYSEYESGALLSRIEEDQLANKKRQQELIEETIEIIDDEKIRGLALALLEDEYFSAQVQVVHIKNDLSMYQKRELTLDLLDVYLEEKRKSNQGRKFFVYNENLLLLRKHRSAYIRNRYDGDIEMYRSMLADAQDSNRRIRSELDVANAKIRHQDLLSRNHSYESPLREHSLYTFRRRFYYHLLVKAIILLNILLMAGALLRSGYIDIAGILLGLFLGQVTAEIFGFISRRG